MIVGMTEQVQQFLAGLGSVLDVAPVSDYERYVPKATPSERMASRWARVGNCLRRALERYEREQTSQTS